MSVSLGQGYRPVSFICKTFANASRPYQPWDIGCEMQELSISLTLFFFKVVTGSQTVPRLKDLLLNFPNNIPKPVQNVTKRLLFLRQFSPMAIHLPAFYAGTPLSFLSTTSFGKL